MPSSLGDLVGQAFVGPPGLLLALMGPCGVPWALVGQALVGGSVGGVPYGLGVCRGSPYGGGICKGNIVFRQKWSTGFNPQNKIREAHERFVF